ncbi:MAG: hypothetical protein HY263_10790 [Chloroflexi bacterium]|nr:hypothetical protein [Chloroflexota bacterium]
MRRPLAVLAALVVAACTSPSPVPSAPGPSSVATSASSPSPTPTPPPTASPEPTATPEPTAPPPTVIQLIGSKLMVAMDGTTPSAALLKRIRQGKIGGVILFDKNLTTEAALIALTRQLQAAATAGGQPRLLISTDQEGGSVKRLPWAPPTLSPPQMGQAGSVTTAWQQGELTGAALLRDGINLDLGPVADVPISTSSFMYQQGRTWSFSAATTTSMADAFAGGLLDGGGVAAMKHFPGLGYALRNTDLNVVTITATKAQLDAGLDPYRGMGLGTASSGPGLGMVMLSNAWYTAYDRANAAGWSHAIGTTLLRDEIGFNGITITDSLNGIGEAMGVPAKTLAIKAAAAGTDMILLTGPEASTSAAYTALVAALNDGTIPRSVLEASYDRILALRLALAG